MGKRLGKPRQTFKTEIQVFNALKKKIENRSTLSEIEYSICPIELKKIYANYRVRAGKLDEWGLEMCDQEEIHQSVRNAIRLDEQIKKEIFLKITDEDLLNEYLNGMIISGHILEDYEIEKLDQKCLNEYVQNMIDNHNYMYISYKNFLLLSEEIKIKVIFTIGLSNVDYEIQEWFKSWQEIERRNTRINQILSD